MMTGKAGDWILRRKNILIIGTILLIGILGSLLILYSTQWGPWVYSDSAGYILSARNLLAGHGLGLYGPSGAFRPLSIHPPLFSLMLSLFGWIGFDLIATARWMNAILFGLTIIIVGLSILATTRSSWLSVISCILLLSMPDLTYISSGAMSEPLFFFLGFASLCALQWFFINDRRLVLLAAAAAAGLSIVTRYAGLAFMITGIAFLFIFSRKAFKNRILDVFIYGMVGSLPVLAWFVHLKLQSSSARLILLPLNLKEGLVNLRLWMMDVIWSWLPFPNFFPHYSYNLTKYYLLLAAGLMIALTSLTLWRAHKNKLDIRILSSGLPFVGLMVILAIAYLVVLVISYLFLLPPPVLSGRLLIPVHITVILGFFGLCFFFIRTWLKIKWIPLIPVIIALGFFIYYMQGSIKFAVQLHQNGDGYTSRNWRNSQTIHAAQQLPTNISLISNDSAAVYFYTNRPAYDIYELIDKIPQSFTRYGDDPTDPAQRAFRSRGAALILFNSIYGQFESIYWGQTEERMENFTKGLYLFAQLKDGRIYFYTARGR